MQPGEKPGGESAHVLYHKNSGMKLSACADVDNCVRNNNDDNKTRSERPYIVLVEKIFQISFIFLAPALADADVAAVVSAVAAVVEVEAVAAVAVAAAPVRP